VGIPLGARAVVHPVIGYCRGDDDFGEIVFGGGGAFNAWNSVDGRVHLNVQAHAARNSFEGGSEMSIPIMASVLYNVNEGTSIFGSAGVAHYRISYDEGFVDFSGSSTDPAAAGGVQFSAGNLHISAGLQFVSGDGDSSIGAFGGIRIPIG
jgi:opacity protein-like surface antigen